MKNPVALVTGASRGIGRAIARRLAADGYFVFINYRSNADAAAEALVEVRSAGGDGALLAGDVSDAAEVSGLFAEIENTRKRLDVLVNNAGVTHEALFALTSPTRFMDIVRQNLGSVVLCSHAAIRLMLRQRSGAIVNVSSASAFRGSAGMSAYAASKAAVNVMTASLAREVASFGIRVNAVAPSWIDTDMMTSTRREMIGDTLLQTPLRRLGTPEEVAAAVAAIIRDDMSYLIGQVLLLDGGGVR